MGEVEIISKSDQMKERKYYTTVSSVLKSTLFLLCNLFAGKQDKFQVTQTLNAGNV